MKRTSRDSKQKIFETLTKLKQATWNDLQKETGLSKGALSKHLNLLIKFEYVRVDVDTSTTPRTIKYSPSPLYQNIETYKKTHKRLDKKEVTLSKHEKDVKELVFFSVQSGYYISQVKDRTEAQTLMKEYLAYNLDNLSLEILAGIFGSFHFSKGYMLRKKDKNKQKQLEIFIKRLKKYCIKELIEPWIESLATSAFYNQDLMDAFWTTHIEERSKKMNLSILDSLEELISPL